MSYLVLARKYRPQKFSELVGQDHVTQTLQNAFKQGKVGQAYLFTGTRGVGKTSVGRILAKALRCEDPLAQPGRANYGIPCNHCPSCLEVGQSNALDVLEIDGASNNGVDNVREIRDNVKFMPSRGRMKVYIIDEVHMLTGAAFNALLKTLEEPPAHVAFIFATTEVHKVPATILSRCQRFDLKRVPQALIFDYLLQLVQKENIQAQPEAIQRIAKKAEGSVRDALSLLDQVIALSGKELTAEKAETALGGVDRHLLQKILSAILQKQSLPALEQVQVAYDAGVEMKNLATSLAELLRNAVLCKAGATALQIGVSEDERADLLKIIENTSAETLQAAFSITSQAIHEIARSPFPRANLEMSLLRVAQLGALASIEDLLNRLATIEKKSVLSAPQNPTPLTVSNAPIAHASPEEFSWKHFVGMVTKHKPNIGTLLEHAIPVTPLSQWKSAEQKNIKIGFRENQAFYFDQAKAGPVFSTIEKILNAYVGMVKKLEIEKVLQPAETHQEQTISEKNARLRLEKTDSLKQKFLTQNIVRDTNEIFGSEWTEFDIRDEELH